MLPIWLFAFLSFWVLDFPTTFLLIVKYSLTDYCYSADISPKSINEWISGSVVFLRHRVSLWTHSLHGNSENSPVWAVAFWGRYSFPGDVSRSKAASIKRWSSVRWVCLFPVAGAAAGSRPAYLHKHTGTNVKTETQGFRLCWPWLDQSNMANEAALKTPRYFQKWF